MLKDSFLEDELEYPDKYVRREVSNIQEQMSAWSIPMKGKLVKNKAGTIKRDQINS